MKNIVVLVSGGGTNLQALLDAQDNGIIKEGKITCVISSKPGVYALERAANNGIPSAVVSRKDFASIDEWDDAVVKAVESSGAELVVLAGYLSLLGPKIVSKYSNRIINIHPALIPSFCGAGMYGIRPHKAALAKGVKVSGATVHFVKNSNPKRFPQNCKIPSGINTHFESTIKVIHLAVRLLEVAVFRFLYTPSIEENVIKFPPGIGFVVPQQFPGNAPLEP